MTDLIGPGATGLLRWIERREAIRRRREAGEPPPWTTDPILAEYRFCNVRREDDRITKWIAGRWREPHADDPDLWFAMVVARFVNWPETLDDLGFPVPWEPDRFLAVMAERDRSGDKRYHMAYRIRADQTGRYAATPIYQVEQVFAPLWAARARLRPRPGDTLRGWNDRLTPHHGLGGGFMSAQVVADMKQVAPLRDAPDWWTFAASGPGSRRGLNRVLGRPVDARWREIDWRAALRRLHEAIAPELERLGIGRLCAQDVQNCLCEYDKSERLRLGDGHYKRRFALAA